MTEPMEDIRRSFGPYRVVQQLGKGAMGAVYEAQHAELDRAVALKIVLDPITDSDLRLRFLRELKLSCGLVHPSLIRVLDAGEIDGVAYLAMELVQGETLQSVIERAAPLDWKTSLAIVARLADGLAYLHGRDMLHRDVKPANVLVSHAGEVKLADFGLLRNVDSTRMTEAGRVVGTLLYMAPEMLSLGTFSPASDLWALGCIAHQLLAGGRVWRVSSGEELIEAIVNQRVTPPDEVVRSVPPAVSRLVMSLLERNVRHRLSSGETLRDEAARLLELVGGTAVDAVLAAGFLDRLNPIDPSAAPVPAPDASATVPLPVAPRRPARPEPRRVSSVAPAPRRPGAPALAAICAVVLVLASAAFLPRGAGPVASPSPTVARAEPSPTVSTEPLAPTDLFSRWRSCVGLLGDLTARGDRGKRAVAEARRRAAPVDLGDRTAPWRFWIELGLWLETGRMSRATIEVASAAAQRITTPAAFASESALGRLGSTLRKKDLPALIEHLETDAADGRWWLVLGRVLELERRADAAVRVYRMAMERLEPGRVDITARLAWAGLTRALMVLEGHALEKEIWTWLARTADPEQAYEGIEDVLLASDHVRLRALLETGIKTQEHGVGAYLALGRYWVLRGDAARGKGVWAKGWSRYPQSAELERKSKGLPRPPRSVPPGASPARGP